MSRENIELLRSSYEAWNRRGYDAVNGILDPELELRLPEGGLNTGIRRGREPVRQFLETVLEAFDSVRLEPEGFFDKHDRVVVLVRLVARGRGSGVELAIRPAHVWTIRSGKAVRLDVYPERDRDRALESLG
jgi:ketosteroid isomerase-like protein